MEIVKKKLSEIRPYPNNPRKNDSAVDAVVESIRQCGYIAPIIVDEDGVILAGHTRYKALKKLGEKSAEVIIRDGLTEEQKRKYRLLDNKINELAEWDLDLLADELDGLDFGELELEWGLDAEDEFDESDLDSDVEKTNVIVSINCGGSDKYELIRGKLQTVADEIGATVAVKMA